MKYSDFQIDEREAAHGRLLSDVLVTLQEAVAERVREGSTQKEIADRIGCHKSSLSRVLNGHSPNLTLRTVSDILWATDHEPTEFSADPFERLSPNCERPLLDQRAFQGAPVQTVNASVALHKLATNWIHATILGNSTNREYAKR